MKGFLGIGKDKKRDIAAETVQTREVPEQLPQQRPGERIASVMGRMYRLIVSADMDMNSCYVETGELLLGDAELPRMGTYDDFIRVLSVQVDEEERDLFSRIYSRVNLHKVLFSDRSYITGKYTVNDQLCEVRVEKIPELNELSTRVRCCLYIRPVLSRKDDGHDANEPESIKREAELTESDILISSLFVGEYEINPEKNYMVAYKLENGKFRKMNEHMNLSIIIDSYIQCGIIAPESASVYQNLCKRGFLEKKTLRGKSYIIQAKLRSPGAQKYQWYDEIVSRMGNSYKIYRRNVDEYKKAQETQLRLEEQTKYANYNRTMLENMASLVEFRNVESGAHVTNVRKVTETLLEDIANRSPQYGIDRHRINIIAEAATIHDIGKITIPDHILNKPALLTSEEYEIMREHATSGAVIIDRMSTEELKELYDCCRDVVLHHHERYDGKGYPEGLVGDNISIAAQVVGMADAFDALVSERCYKHAYPHDVAFRMIADGECGKFSDRLVESLRVSLERIREFYDYSDVDKRKKEEGC